MKRILYWSTLTLVALAIAVIAVDSEPVYGLLRDGMVAIVELVLTAVAWLWHAFLIFACIALLLWAVQGVIAQGVRQGLALAKSDAKQPKNS